MAHWDDSGTAVGYEGKAGDKIIRRSLSGPKPSRKTNPYSHIKKEGGKRSGLETAVAADLSSKGVQFKGEKELKAIEYSNLKVKKYHPDFELPNGIIIESKGWFKTQDRTKHLCIKSQHPELDIRFVFSNPNAKLDSKSKTTYASWCMKYDFKYAKGLVPPAWIDEPKKPSAGVIVNPSLQLPKGFGR